MFRVALTTFLLVACASTADVPTNSSLEGTWIGWVYLSDSGDLPLRLDVSQSGHEVAIAVDSPKDHVFGSAAKKVQWSPPALRFEWQSPKGTSVEVLGSIGAEAYSGTVVWGAQKGTFELIRSPLPLANPKPDAADSLTGLFTHGRDDVIHVRARPWGELFFNERKTGRYRTLMPLAGSNDRFLIGPANSERATSKFESVAGRQGQLSNCPARFRGMIQRLRLALGHHRFSGLNRLRRLIQPPAIMNSPSPR